MRDFIVLWCWLSPAIKAKCCNRPAVRDAVALLNLCDFENCGLASLRDSDPGDDLRFHAIGQGVGKLDKLANETVDGHGIRLERFAAIKRQTSSSVVTGQGKSSS